MRETQEATGLFGPGYATDPYPVLADLRAAGPAHRVRRPDGLELWLITRHAEARAALNDPRLSRDAERVDKVLADRSHGPNDLRLDMSRNMLSSDPPAHTRLRRLVAGVFTRRRVEQLRPRVHQIADDLLDAIAPRGRADLIDDYAAQLPVIVICELLGVPVEDRQRLRRWTLAAFQPRRLTHEGTPREEGIRGLRDYLADLIAAKRAETGRPGGDMLSALIAARDADAGRLSEPELHGTALLLLIAGHETTVNLIGNGALALLRHPRQLAALRRDPSLLPEAIEELLRFDGPLETATVRVATEDVTIGDTVIPAGALVNVVLAAADRDPAGFPDPDELRITRPDNPHLAFGHGIHHCLGAPLARLEGQVAIGSLLRRFPDLTLAADPEELRWRRTVLVRGLHELPVTFTPTAGGVAFGAQGGRHGSPTRHHPQHDQPGRPDDRVPGRPGPAL
jgi:cytochrome P450